MKKKIIKSFGKKMAAMALCVACMGMMACDVVKDTTDEETPSVTEATTLDSSTPPSTIVIYNIMRFTTTVPESGTTAAYQYAEEVNLDENTYSYSTSREYYSTYQFYSSDGAFLHFRIGDMQCSFRAPNPNISTLTSIVNNINEYATAITTGEQIGQNGEDWVYYSVDSKNSAYYEMLIPKGTDSPSTLMKMDKSTEKTAKALNEIKIEEITKLSYSKSSFSECVNVDNSKIETLIEAFNKDIAGLKSSEDVEAFEKKLADEGMMLQDWYLSKVLATDD